LLIPRVKKESRRTNPGKYKKTLNLKGIIGSRDEGGKDSWGDQEKPYTKALRKAGEKISKEQYYNQVTLIHCLEAGGKKYDSQRKLPSNASE